MFSTAHAQPVPEPALNPSVADIEAVTASESAAKHPAPRVSPRRKPARRAPGARAAELSSTPAIEIRETWDFSGWTTRLSARPFFGFTVRALEASAPTMIRLSSFSGDAASGSIRSGTTWEGNVAQGAASITIGGTARDDNGWGKTGLALDVSGMNFITITAQRDTGNQAGTLFLQLEDLRLTTSVFSVDTSLISFDTPTQVQISITGWPVGFDSTNITGWNIGGGGLGTQDFRMTLYGVDLSATAIPEPAEIAALSGLVALAAAAYRRRSVKQHSPPSGS
jgi:hypothetical protein